MFRWTMLAGLILAAGCQPPENFDLGGYQMYELFPYDGQRTWEFTNEDQGLSWRLKAQTRDEDPLDEVSADYSVYHVDYTTDCVAADDGCNDGDNVRTIGWSSDTNNGVLIHSLSTNGNLRTFDPPLVVAEREMNVKDVVSTSTDGYTFTSTFIAMEHCPTEIDTAGWGPNCAHLRIDDGDADDLTNLGLVGDYWAIKGQNVVGMTIDAEYAHWGLSFSDCTPDEDCRGEW